jgi:hypothetical protein
MGVIRDLITSAVGIIVGVLTGYYFEHRSTKAARAQNDELKRQLQELRETVYSLGGSSGTTVEIPPSGDLVSDVLRWASTVQDPSGRVAKSQLMTHFIESGKAKADVDDALNRLSTAGSIRLADHWIVVT